MTELPSGTVTFLFTDVEGSTQLLKRLGDAYHEVLADHQRLLREAFAAHGGHEIDTQGDSFFVAFRRAKDAVAAAVAAQRSLAAHDWPEGGRVRVRIGLHSGEPLVGEQRYVGLGVHKAARISAAGHGGQVLLSSATYELVADDLPTGVKLRDLGQRRLKDIDRPERIFQLVVEGLPADFPRLMTADERPPMYRRRTVLVGALAGVIAAAVAIPLFAFGQGGSSGGTVVGGNAVAILDPHTNRVVGQVPVGQRPGAIAFGSGSLWVANLDDQNVSRINPTTRSLLHNIPVGHTPTGLAATKAAVWVVGSDPTGSDVAVTRIDPQFDVVAKQTHVGNVVPAGPGTVATEGDAVWVAPSTGLLTRLDPSTSLVVHAIDPNSGQTAIALGAGAAWVADSDANTVTRVDPTGLLNPIAVGHGPIAIAVGLGGVWVADSLDDRVVRIDPGTRATTKSIPVGAFPSGIAVGAGYVWVANSRDGTVSRIDPRTAKVVKTIRVGGSPQAIVVAAGEVWVTVQTPATGGGEPASPGGTARVNAELPLDSVDPALAFVYSSWQILYPTCAKLLNYPDLPGSAGSRLIAEVAQSLPAHSADGKTYTFTIRKGFRFSPPSNQPVTAETFKYTIERSLSPKMNGPVKTNGYLSDVVGADAYAAGKAAHVAGVIARGDRLTIQLVTPAPDLVSRLALPFFCAVPVGTPLDPKGLRTIPAAGPYFVAANTPGQSVVLERNPNYRGSRPHRLARIQLTIGVARAKTDQQIEAGTADYGLDGIAPGDAGRLASSYGARSPAAKKEKQRYFVDPALQVAFYVLNTHRPLFADARLRRAVNFSVDRRALARLGLPPSPLPGAPTDQYLPPGMPGFKDVHVYPLSGDLSAARRLAGGKRRSAVLYTCNVTPCDKAAQVIKTDLGAIGIAVQIKAFPIGALFARVQRPGEPFDLAWFGWNADYPDPDDFLNVLLEGGFAPTFDDPAWVRKLAAAAKLTGPKRYLAYGKLDADLARNGAPFIPYSNAANSDFLSARMGCVTYQPVYGLDLAALCIAAK